MTDEENEVIESVVSKMREMCFEVMQVVKTGDKDKVTGYTLRLVSAAAKEDASAIAKIAIMNLLAEDKCWVETEGVSCQK